MQCSLCNVHFLVCGIGGEPIVPRRSPSQSENTDRAAGLPPARWSPLSVPRAPRPKTAAVRVGSPWTVTARSDLRGHRPATLFPIVHQYITCRLLRLYPHCPHTYYSVCTSRSSHPQSTSRQITVTCRYRGQALATDT